jgi:hypothetical protein
MHIFTLSMFKNFLLVWKIRMTILKKLLVYSSMPFSQSYSDKVEIWLNTFINRFWKMLS